MHACMYVCVCVCICICILYMYMYTVYCTYLISKQESVYYHPTQMDLSITPQGASGNNQPAGTWEVENEKTFGTGRAIRLVFLLNEVGLITLRHPPVNNQGFINLGSFIGIPDSLLKEPLWRLQEGSSGLEKCRVGLLGLSMLTARRISRLRAVFRISCPFGLSHLGFVRFRFLESMEVKTYDQLAELCIPQAGVCTLEQRVVEEKWVGASPTKCFWGMAMTTRKPRELRSLQGTDHRNPCWAGCWCTMELIGGRSDLVKSGCSFTVPKIKSTDHLILDVRPSIYTSGTPCSSFV